MIEELQALIEQALSGYMQSKGGGMVNAWYLVADVVDADGGQSWLFSNAPDQLLMTTMGLIEWARGAAMYEQRCYLAERGADDED